jgi:hypothetical protein
MGNLFRKEYIPQNGMNDARFYQEGDNLNDIDNSDDDNAEVVISREEKALIKLYRSISILTEPLIKEKEEMKSQMNRMELKLNEIEKNMNHSDPHSQKNSTFNDTRRMCPGNRERFQSRYQETQIKSSTQYGRGYHGTNLLYSAPKMKKKSNENHEKTRGEKVKKQKELERETMIKKQKERKQREISIHIIICYFFGENIGHINRRQDLLEMFKEVIEGKVKNNLGKEKNLGSNGQNKKTIKWRVSLHSLEEIEDKLLKQKDQVYETFPDERLVVINVKQNYIDTRNESVKSDSKFKKLFEDFQDTIEEIDQLTVRHRNVMNGLNSELSDKKIDKKLISVIYLYLDIKNKQPNNGRLSNNYHLKIESGYPFKIEDIDEEAEKMIETVLVDLQSILKN